MFCTNIEAKVVYTTVQHFMCFCVELKFNIPTVVFHQNHINIYNLTDD